ncbi:MAG: hypothetical protein ACU85V_15405 [Gammaproteobacteria bacterium]
MRRRFIQDRETGKLVEVTNGDPRRRRRRVEGPSVLPDIEPYHSTITGELITSRSKHREHLREHDCQEIGSEIPKFLRAKYERDGERPVWGRDGRRVDI